MQKIINSNFNELYDDKGYFTIPSFLNQEEVNELLKNLLSKKIDQTGFYTSTCINDSSYRDFCNKAIQEIVTSDKINRYLQGYSTFYANFINKTPQSKSEVVLHTDWSIMDEDIYKPFKIWIPLIDVNKENGTFSLVSGSHKYTNKHRGFGAREYYTAYSKEIIDNCLTYLNFPAGQALFYHPGMLHYSPPNNSTVNRPAILVSLYPSDTQAILYYKNWYNFFNSMSVYKFDANYMNIWDKQSQPKALKHIKNIKEYNKVIEKNKFITLLSKN